MERQTFFDPQRKVIALAVAASGVAAVVGWGLSQRHPTPAGTGVTASAEATGTNAGSGMTAMASLSPTDFLAAIPDPLAATPKGAEREIAKWKTKTTGNPTDATNWLNLGDALMQKARESANHQYYDMGERAYNQSLVLYPRKSEAMTGLAWVAGERHLFPQSIEWANKALAINAKDEEAYGLIGDAQIELGDYNEAYKSYQKMLDIRPDLASYSRGATLLYLTGDTRKGMWLMTKAIKAGGAYSENSAWCNAKLAEMLVGEGAVMPAESILKDAIKVAPNDYHVLAAMGKIKTARGKYEEAIELYKKAVAVAPQHNGLVALGDLYETTGQKDKAEETFTLVEKLHEEHKKYGSADELYMARFFADHDRQLPRALAIADLHKDAKNAVAADTVAWVYYKNGKLPEAKTAITRALTATAPDAAVLYHAGMIDARLGAVVSAKKYIYQAMSRNPYFSLLDVPVAAATLQKLGSANPALPDGGVAVVKGNMGATAGKTQ